MITINDKDFIKNFSKITVNKICKRINIDTANVLNGRTTDEKMHIVRTEIEKEIAKLYLE